MNSRMVLAFVLGATANRFRVSPLVGYLLAGVLIGPFTPGYVADQGIARDLAYSESTIKGVLAKIMTRLEARNRCHAIAIVVRQGLI